MYAVESCRERLDTGEIKVINQPVAWNGERARPQPTFTFQFHGRPGAPVLRALRSARHRMPRAAGRGGRSCVSGVGRLLSVSAYSHAGKPVKFWRLL